MEKYIEFDETKSGKFHFHQIVNFELSEEFIIDIDFIDEKLLNLDR